MRILASITRNSALLALFALLTTFLIAGTWLLTKDTIAGERRKAEERALLEIIPRERHDNSMLDDTRLLAAGSHGLGLREDRQLYIARNDGEPVAVIVPVLARDGYSGDIELIVGVNADGSVAGVRVLNHRETPGLGDKVDLKKSDWILDFDGRSLGNPALAEHVLELRLAHPGHGTGLSAREDAVRKKRRRQPPAEFIVQFPGRDADPHQGFTRYVENHVFHGL